jgi:hypothetical protein
MAVGLMDGDGVGRWEISVLGVWVCVLARKGWSWGVGYMGGDVYVVRC